METRSLVLGSRCIPLKDWFVLSGYIYGVIAMINFANGAWGLPNGDLLIGLYLAGFAKRLV